MKLRNWQSECITSAITKYNGIGKHFLALATPAAGKTFMASALAKNLFDLNKIDLVLCFSPSTIVAHDFSGALSEQFDAHFDGTIGSMGHSYTYQGINTLSENIWGLFERYRVFVIFDEIHHCAGSNIKDANSWGEPIIARIKDHAAFTIALTGTPWRSDSLPIVLADYCNDSGQIQCDYTYGLKSAIRDDVCRTPQVVALDNDQITIAQCDDVSHFTSFNDLISQSTISYSKVVRNDMVIEQLLARANDKLNVLGLVNPSVGGLIVASSISHAKQIKQILWQVLGESANVVTSDEANANALIEQYRRNQDRWIISVGMISEGTNIPRLQVCCYLSNIRTEMYYRQVLGRILRITDSPNQEAILFMPAEPKLVEYAYRVAQDIPDGIAKVKLELMDEGFEADINLDTQGEDIDTIAAYKEYNQGSLIAEFGNKNATSGEVTVTADDINNKELNAAYEEIMGISGRFKHETLCIEGFEHLVISEQFVSKLHDYGVDTF